MRIAGLFHIAIKTNDLAATIHFYKEVMGLVEVPRPNFGFPGAWLYAGGRAIVHVYADRPVPAQRAGVIDHIAFT